MTKRKILFYLIVLGILFVVNLILIFWGKQIFKIKADAVPVCGSGPCVSNPSINFGFYWKRVPNAGAETLANEFNESKNAIAQQFKMITFAAGLSGSPDSYGETFQMVLDQAAQIKNLNPSRQVYSYRWTISKISQLDPDIVNKTLDPDGNNRQCFLRYQTGDKKGQPILLTGQGAYVMDVTSQCWKNYLANSINSQANLYGVNGVMFDGVMPALADTIAPYPQTITDTHLPANYAANWKANIQKLLTDVKAQIGDNKILWISKPCDYDGSDNDCSKDFIPYADGFMYERFSFWAQGSSPNIDVDYKSPAFLSVEQFKSNLDMAFTAQKQGQIVYLSNWVKPTADLQSDTVKQFQRFLLSSYLLASGPTTFYGAAIDNTFYDDPKDRDRYTPYTKLSFFDDWKVDVGQPQSAYEIKNGIFSRQFSKALIVVNPNDEAKSMILDKNYYTPEGVKVSGNYTLADHTGQILLKDDTGNELISVATATQDSAITTGGAGQLISTGTSIYYIILVVLAILLTILLKQYAKKD